MKTAAESWYLFAMMFFLLFGIPFFILFIYNFAYAGSVDGRTALKDAARGLLGVLPALVVYSVIDNFFRPAYEGPKLYLTRTFLDFILPFLLSCVAYILFYKKEIIVPGDYQLQRFLAFNGGFFAVFAFFAFFRFQGWYEGYYYLLMPLLWMVMLLSSGYTLGVFFSSSGLIRFPILFAVFALLFLLGFIPFLYISNHLVLSWFGTISIFSGTILSFKTFLTRL